MSLTADDVQNILGLLERQEREIHAAQVAIANTETLGEAVRVALSETPEEDSPADPGGDPGRASWLQRVRENRLDMPSSVSQELRPETGGLSL